MITSVSYDQSELSPSNWSVAEVYTRRDVGSSPLPGTTRKYRHQKGFMIDGQPQCKQWGTCHCGMLTEGRYRAALGGISLHSTHLSSAVIAIANNNIHGDMLRKLISPYMRNSKSTKPPTPRHSSYMRNSKRTKPPTPRHRWLELQPDRGSMNTLF